jgi:hypothetical protein
MLFLLIYLSDAFIADVFDLFVVQSALAFVA